MKGERRDLKLSMKVREVALIKYLTNVPTNKLGFKNHSVFSNF
jgi:hypothetical protein